VPTDINPMRERLIHTNGLGGADRPYTLYYDETNNIRRLHVTAEGFNVAEPACFALGGVGHAGSPRPLDLAGLHQAVRLQPSAKELKLEHLGKGGFLQLLASRKLTAYLDWVTGQDLFIHYLVLDPLYWSCVDIIDAVLVDERMGHMIQFHRILKNDLFAVLRSDKRAVADLFFAFDYPNIAPHRHSEFIEAVRAWVDDRDDLLEHFNHQVLKDVLKAGKTAKELPFIEGYEPKTLIDDFTGFFIERFALFKNAAHILDDESKIRGRLEAVDLRDGDRPLANHRFVDSKAEAGVQISDPMIGLIGKFATYIGQSPPAFLIADRAQLTPTQRGNLNTFNGLLDRSVAESAAFFNNVLANDDHQAAAWFLDGRH
jgi:hypothetical protein